MDPRLKTRFDESDVMQEALIVAQKRLDSFLNQRQDLKMPMPFYPWLRRIVLDRLHNLRETHLADKRSVDREIREFPSLPDESVDLMVNQIAGEMTSPSERLSLEEEQRQVRQAVLGLRDQDREITELRYLEHLDNEEIGSVLGITVAAVRTRHFRAIQRLHAALRRASSFAADGNA
jgi:RNA polymerase sigma-70 factor (ECF subfamily)